ncbi:hypothetical protein LMG29542_08714 [Paraburkholderia humisilvae]|uniref:Uncharacterized protein n=1 Tax=Paraburkholderia humisilvae TaxID=627669 RepID=A0A6J5FCC2_9BURK|nr:hypothetical protein LMG29542_08714 [Paraburkholderia humisilvae]
MAVQLKLPFFAIGDQVSVTSIPEAYLAQKGERLFYADERIWAFKHNPYIDFRQPGACDTELLTVPDSRMRAHVESYFNHYNSIVFGSQTEFLLHSRA